MHLSDKLCQTNIQRKMRIDSELLEKAKADKQLNARLAIALNKSTRTIDRYLHANSFPDKLESEVLTVLKDYES